VVQVRPTSDGLMPQQLLYAEELRSLKDLQIEKVEISPPEWQLALQLIEQIAQDTFDLTAFAAEEKKRVLAAIDEKISGRQIVAAAPSESPAGAQVIDLMEARKASFGQKRPANAPRPGQFRHQEQRLPPRRKIASVVAMQQPKKARKEVARRPASQAAKERKPARHSAAPAQTESATPRSRARK
jgi:DNA end-binding protein Ku